MRRILLLLVGAMILSGCGTMGMPMPQTVEEFRTAVAGTDSSWVKSESKDFKRRWGDVQKSMQKYAARCLNYKTTHTRNGAVMYVEYQRTFFEKTGKYKSYMAMQVESPAFSKRDDVPDGGVFRMIVDMESIGKGKSRVTYHGPGMFFGKQRDALWEASEGKEPKYCPGKS
ncbi:hypothetical protein ACFLZI_01580 [Nitrospirota bacterium]